MICTNYKAFKTIASNSQRGFWRAQAIAKLNNRIERGQTQLIFLREKLKKTIPNYFNIQITNLTKKNKSKKKFNFPLKNNKYNNNNNFFLTSIFKNNNDKFNINKILFPYFEEREIYNQINLLPFKIKNIRPRTGSERIFNRIKIEKEINKKFDLIMREKFHNLTLNENNHINIIKNYYRNFNNINNRNLIERTTENFINNNKYNNDYFNRNRFMFKRKLNHIIRLSNSNDINNSNNFNSNNFNSNNINSNNNNYINTNYINTYNSTRSSYTQLNTLNNKPKKRILSAIL